MLVRGRKSHILQVAERIPVVENRACDEKYQTISNVAIPNGITEDFICAGREQRRTRCLSGMCHKISVSKISYACHKNSKAVRSSYCDANTSADIQPADDEDIKVEKTM
ncbi:hypothetical protein CEXT_259071 [Caerostris extrusa]|uniref:Uncharacterized protein n=1 Tax=Caerostris extrusa TaxID=172846 RepID=A0AAV4SSR1_CAEEX|nr:hypothetical protein CEXT_259071 [Caerostris extrusa]